MRGVVLGGVLSVPVLMAGGQIDKNAPIPPTWNQTPGQKPTPNVRPSDTTEDPADAMRAKQLGKLNSKHQQQAREDAAKLLELATSLNEQLKHENGVTTSAKAMADADRIQALAKGIKGNLRQF